MSEENGELVYVHAQDYSRFTAYQRAHPELTCMYITDGAFLRGRTPARIKVLDGAFAKWDSGEIMECIFTHQEVWKDELQRIEDQKNLNEIKPPEEGENTAETDFYGI